MELGESISKTTAGNHLTNQLIRSATAAAPNYAAARAAESPRDFVHKLGLALKELNEAEVWLDILMRRGVLPGGTPRIGCRYCHLSNIAGSTCTSATKETPRMRGVDEKHYPN